MSRGEDRRVRSEHWHLVAELTPRLRNHTRLQRQTFRGGVWYVLQDRRTGRYHRFSQAAYLVITLMDGQRTVEQVWERACIELGDDVLTQDEFVLLLAQLHSSDVLQADTAPDLTELGIRAARVERRTRVMGFLNPLAIRIPLLDPERFLSRLYPVVRPLFSWLGALVYLGIVASALVLVGMHWDPLTGNLIDRVLVFENLIVLLVSYPVVKSLHELGHGFAVKHWGGEVHEIGVMFLVFMPVPYVDASAAAGFPNKWQRAFVGAAGILVELFLAACAMFIWVAAEEGLARAFAFNVMLIGGVSTLLFNGNPLLRFDGYYVFSDFLEIPNLSVRANKYLGYLVKTKAFGLEVTDNPAGSIGEARWLVFYAIASFIYRLFIMIAIATFVATSFFVVGVLIALWAIGLMLVWPVAKNLWFLIANPSLTGHRRRAMSVTSGAILSVVALLGLVPVPYSSVAQGVLWSDGEVSVQASAEGVVRELLVEPESIVAEGDPLFRLEDPFLEARVDYLRARVAELELREADQLTTDLVAARIVSEQLTHAKADLQLALERQEGLLILSHARGKIVIPNAKNLHDRFIYKGEVVAYIARIESPILRVVVSEDEAEIVRQRDPLDRVSVRAASDIGVEVDGRVTRELPALSQNLPSMALSTLGGGAIPVDPGSGEVPLALGNWMQLEIEPDQSLTADRLGGRVYVKFHHGFEPLWPRIYRSVRQVFLKQFGL